MTDSFTAQVKKLEKMIEDIAKGLFVWHHQGLFLDNYSTKQAKAIRYWSEGIRHKYGKQPRRWLITERGGNETERVHIHGIIFTDLDNDKILKSWTFGIADDGRSTGRAGWVNEQTINYITKYVFKTDSKHIDFKGRIFASGGIGKAYLQDELNRYRHRYQGDIDNEIAAKAIRYWSESIRHKHGKQPRRWLVTERGAPVA